MEIFGSSLLDSLLNPSASLALTNKKLFDQLGPSGSGNFSEDTKYRTELQNQINNSNLPEEVKQTASELPSSWKINSSQTEKKKGYTPAEVNSFDKNYSRVNKKDNYWAKKIGGPTEEPSEEAVKAVSGMQNSPALQWFNEKAPVSGDLVTTEVDGQQRVKLEPSKSKFADEYENQLENGELSGEYGIPNYYSDPSESMAQDWHHLIASIGNLPKAGAKAAYGEPEWGYNLDNGRYASYDDLDKLYSDEGFTNSYLLSKDDNQVYQNGNGWYVELPSGAYGQVSDNEDNSLLSYDPETDSFGFPNTDERLDYADTEDAVLVPGVPVNMSEQMPNDYMPNSNITWQDFMDLIKDSNVMPTQQNPGFLNLNQQRWATPESEADDLSRIKDSLPESPADFPNWFINVLASSAPFMLPGPVGPAVGLTTGLSDTKLASMGLDPTSYDPESQTYAPAVEDTNSDRMWRMGGAFTDPVIDAALGVGGMKLGQKLNNKLLDKVASGDHGAIKKAIRKMQRSDFNQKYPVLPNLGEIVGEGIEEVPGQWMQHVADVGGLENLGMNKNEEGEDDYNTPVSDRIKNEMFNYVLPDFLGGALFGGALKAPQLATSTIKTGKSLKDARQERKNRFKDFNVGTEEYDITDKMKQYIKSQEEPNGEVY